jgi:hypothetical protein
LLVHIGDPSSNQATTLESQMIHMIQELFGQTVREARRCALDSRAAMLPVDPGRRTGCQLGCLMRAEKGHGQRRILAPWAPDGNFWASSSEHAERAFRLNALLRSAIGMKQSESLVRSWSGQTR